MKFFGGSKKPASSSSSSSKKHASTTSVDDHEDVQHHPHSEPPSPVKPSASSRSPKKSSRPASYRDSREPKPSSSPRQSRLSRHATEPTSSSSSRRKKLDTDTHPLNLPPEERKRYSELSNLSNSAMSGRNSMDIDREPVNASPPPPPNPSAQTNFSVPIPNGTTNNEEGPVPPPHKSNPSSPVPTPEDDADAYKAAGNRLFKDKNYTKAIEQYSKGQPLQRLPADDDADAAVDLFPDSPTFLGNRAAAYMSNGQYDAALEDCSRAADLDPQNAKVLLRLARIYTGLGRPQEAMTTFGRINPPPSAKDMAPTKDMLLHVDAAKKSLNEGTAGSMVLHALDMAERGLGPGVGKPRKWQLMRGEAYIAMGRENSLGEAQNIAMSLLRSNSQDPEGLVLRGRVLYGQGENEKAIQFFRMAVSCDPDFRDAVKWLRVVQKLDRMKEEGNVEFKAGRLQPAIEKYTQALEIDPSNRNMNAKLLQNRAQCKIKLKQYDEAIADAERAVGLDPSYTKARKTKANALGQSGKWEDAVNEWKSIQELDPEDRTIPKEVRRAELELKKSLRKDYYRIMGLEKDAGPDDIKKAYRKMAVKLHPDKNPGDPDAEAKFKDMQEAYETLSDPQKKAAYDNGDDLLDPSDMFGGGGMGGGMGGIDPEILFGMMGNQGGGFGGGGFRTAGGFPGGAGGFPGGGGFPAGASFNFNADEGDPTAEEEEEWGEWEEASADSWDDGPGEAKTASGKLRSDFQRHKEAREELVDTLRRYGTGLLAAAVLLPAQLVALGVVAMALFYVCNGYVGRRRGGAAKRTG
ncbi:DnaJ subfamily C member 7 [Tolypocladium capitatum]|uniref:DnaJ subfamily C member 7 n=1 Tax=Tolypocladium capitatum TaxID=45235 RepID=A0A2K3Q035_9HYPO|nr:DnaJ subfamily C member 7 [Tolypocladium capitatum]